jgi:hypothetical protein
MDSNENTDGGDLNIRWNVIRGYEKIFGKSYCFYRGHYRSEII